MSDLTTGKKLKEEGMAQVLENEPYEWKANYVARVYPFLKTHVTFNNDDVSEFMMASGLPPPHHSGVWGAMFSAHFAKSDYVISTGKTVHAKKATSKARRQTLWRSMLCADEGEMLTMNERLNALLKMVHSRTLDVRAALKLAAQYGAESVV